MDSRLNQWILWEMHYDLKSTNYMLIYTSFSSFHHRFYVYFTWSVQTFANFQGTLYVINLLISFVFLFTYNFANNKSNEIPYEKRRTQPKIDMHTEYFSGLFRKRRKDTTIYRQMVRQNNIAATHKNIMHTRNVCMLYANKV